MAGFLRLEKISEVVGRWVVVLQTDKPMSISAASSLGLLGKIGLQKTD